MTAAPDPHALSLAVVWGGAAIGVVLGAIAQATRFCTMGALADWFGYGGTGRLSMWMLAVAVAATGSMALVALGVFDATRTLAWSDRFPWPSYLVGGGLFGVGMVLSSGCPQRNLVRAGAGNLKSWVTLLFTGFAAQASLRGLLAGPRANGLDAAGLTLPFPQDVGSLLAATGLGHAAAWRAVVLALGLAAVAWMLWRSRGAMDPGHWIGGLGVGLLVPVAWWLTGHLGFVAEHPETLEPAWLGTASRRPEALTFAAPLAHALDLLTLWSDRNAGATFGVTVTGGVVVGSAASALWRREFHLEGFRDAADLGQHLLGALLMGFGGVTALGCSIGQGITGLAMLSAGSALAVASMVGGAWVALRWQAWRIERQA